MAKIRTFFLLVIIVSLAACSTPVVISPTPFPTSTPVPLPTPEYSSWPGVYFGVFSAGTQMEQELGTDFAMQLYYHRWGNTFNGGPFGPNAENGWITMSTWEYRAAFSGVDDPYILQPLKSIVDGNQDEYIRQFARDAVAFDRPLFMRWGHEMNGDWYLWSGFKNGGAATEKYSDPQKADGPELFVDAYRHIHDVFIQEGATRVLWVWCPNIEMSGPLGDDWNDIENYYPGDEYVDWLCMDGYNWGTSQSWSAWQSFDAVFKPTYSHLQQINPDKPIMIGEFAASDKGGDKAAWVTDAFERIRSDYPQIRAVFWFNVNKETDWRMDSSPDVLEVFKNSLTQPGWTSSWPGFEK